MGWRDHLPVHPAADLFPLMSESELRELGEDIKKHGMRYPVVFWEGKDKEVYLLDGRNRLDAMELVGIPAFDDDGKLHHWSLRSGDPHDLVVSLNVHRRHLNVEQRQELLISLIARKPELSNRRIAKKAGVTDKTVAAARAKGEQLRKIPKLEKTEGADGKKRGRPSKAKLKPGDPVLDAINRGEAGDACVIALKERERSTGSAEISIEQRRAENAALDDGDDIVERCLSLIMAMTDQQRAQFFAKYTEWSAARLPARNTTNATD